MAVKVSTNKFVEFLKNRRIAKDGYIMGATGQNPKSWAANSWWFSQYDVSPYTPNQKAKALYWRENAKRVWDCNGLAEGYYQDVTGISINTMARYNYANWCSVKGTGVVPNEHKVPGLAVFKGKTAATITHVGYLVAPVKSSNPNGDWYVIEAKGVMYGVVQTTLNAGGWNYWGYMDKYFDYSNHSEGTEAEENEGFGYRTLRKGSEGSDVKELQRLLMKRDSNCLPQYGADGDFGEETVGAVKDFQKDMGLTVDGIVGKQTYSALDKIETSDSSDATTKVEVTGGMVNVRSTNNTKGKIIAVAKEGEKYDWLATKNDWHQINTAAGKGWISGKYSKVVKE